MSRKTEDSVHINAMVIVREPKALQRKLNPKKINKMIKELNLDLLGWVVIARTETGEYRLLDGQHRRALLEKLRELEQLGELPQNVKDELARVGLERVPQQLKAEIFHGLTDQEQARLFLGYNNTIQVDWLEKFVVRLTAEDPDALLIYELLDKYGWKVNGAGGKGQFTAVATADRILGLSRRIEANPNLLDAALEIVTDAWGHAAEAVHGTTLEGLAQLFAIYGTDVSVDRLKLVLKRLPGGAAGFAADVKTNGRLLKLRPAMAAAYVAHREYNAGKRLDRLPDFTRKTPM